MYPNNKNEGLCSSSQRFYTSSDLETEEILLLDHHIQWPEIRPKRPPKHFQHWVGKRSDTWRSTLEALWLVSRGFTVGREVQHLLAEKYGRDANSGASHRVLPRLVENCILAQAMPSLSTYRKMRLVRLDSMGRMIVRFMEWDTQTGEWERLCRLRDERRKDMDLHTFSVLRFVWQARLRGYRAGVMPILSEDGKFKPDVILEDADGERVLALVERRKSGKRRWMQMMDEQGFIALCAVNPTHREYVVQRVRKWVGGHGQATDLKTLYTGAWEKEKRSPLWAEEW